MGRARAASPLALRLALLAALAAGACMRSPFHTHPSEFALEEPCRYMGTVHKESRNRIEDLRMCGAIAHGEWRCMARALRQIDEAFTVRCRGRDVSFEAIATEKRRRYRECLGDAAPEKLECAILSTDARCLAEQCG